MSSDLNVAHRKQSTLVDCAQVSGFGYWSGSDVRLEFRPAAVDTGITFVREDLPGQPRIPARVNLREEKPRRTNLSLDSHSVEMVEHVMAALAGLQIDNCEVWTTGSEMPGCDGSSLPFTKAIQAAGRQVLSASQPRLVVNEVVRVGDDDAWLEARPANQGMTVEYHLDYGDDSILPAQSACQLVTANTFLETLAPARTFVLQHEANHLRSLGLGLRVTNQDLLVFGPNGPIDNHLRFDNECARHKALDIVGDLALSGLELVGHFIAYRSGHRLNAALASRLREIYESSLQEQRMAS